MTVHHAGTLSVEYFNSYMTLLIHSREFTKEEVRTYMESHFFKGDPLLFGQHTYQSFLTAFEQLEME